MKKTIKEKVIAKVITAQRMKVSGVNAHVLKHSQILKLTKSEDSASRRLREIAKIYSTQTMDNWAYALDDDRYIINPKFVAWLKATQ